MKNIRCKAEVPNQLPNIFARGLTWYLKRSKYSVLQNKRSLEGQFLPLSDFKKFQK